MVTFEWPSLFEEEFLPLLQKHVPTLLAAILTANIGIITALYICWLYDFSNGRVPRTSFQSPSKARMPGNKSHAKDRRVGWSITLKSLLMRSTTASTTVTKANALAMIREGADDDAVVERLGKTQQHLREADNIYERMANRENRRRRPNPDLRPSRKLRGSWGGDKLDLEAEAERLDMDHVALTFWDFATALYLIGPSLMLKEFYGLWFILYGRRFVCRLGYKLGIMKDKRLSDDEARKVVGELVLDTVALPIYLTMIEKPAVNTRTQDGNHDDDDDKAWPIATFTLLKVPLVKNNGEMYIAKDIIVKINLNTRSMIQATMGDRELTPLATYSILVFHVENGGKSRTSSFAHFLVHLYIVIAHFFLLHNTKQAIQKYMRCPTGQSTWRVASTQSCVGTALLLPYTIGSVTAVTLVLLSF